MQSPLAWRRSLSFGRSTTHLARMIPSTNTAPTLPKPISNDKRATRKERFSYDDKSPKHSRSGLLRFWKFALTVCDRGRYVHVSSNRVGVRANLTRAMHDFLCRRLVYSDQRHSERCQQGEVPLFVAAQADLGYNLDLVIGKVVASFSTHSQQSILEASCISCSIAQRRA
jgi:hypothetical protein